MSENNGLASWQKAIEYMNSYEPTDKLSEALQRIKELESQLAEAKKDQARYQYLSRKVGAIQTTDGSKYIFVNLPKCGSHVFKGSVAQHFSDAIDAAIKESGK